MGCDIHTIAQRKTTAGYETISDFAPFDWRCYGMFGFLAGVRNYSAVTPLAGCRGLPDGLSVADSEYFEGLHSCTWLSLAELLAFDYDGKFEDLRVTRQAGPNSWDGGVTGQPGEGEVMTYYHSLGDGFFTDLDRLKAANADRVVMGFDS